MCFYANEYGDPRLAAAALLPSRATYMVCRGHRPPRLDFHGSGAALRAPQRVVGYRPTYRFFLRLSGAVPLTGVLYQKALSRALRLTAVRSDTLGGLVLDEALSHRRQPRYRDRFMLKHGDDDVLHYRHDFWKKRVPRMRHLAEQPRQLARPFCTRLGKF